MIVLQERDLRILREIAIGPACTRSHIAKWIFAGRYEAAKKRVQALIAAGFVERSIGNTAKQILRITDSGLALLHENGVGIDTPAENLTRRLFDHETSLTSCRLSVQATALESDDIGLLSFSHGHDGFSIYCPIHLRTETVRPDGICVLSSRNSENRAQKLFLEIDRSTETLEHLVHLALQYRELLKSREAKEKSAFRVLLIFKSTRRLSSTGNAFLRTGRVKTLVWMTTHEEFERDPFGEIWLCPVDFANGTPAARRRLF